jgi:hypothetical protein
VSTTPVIGCGAYLLNLQCPECGVVLEVCVELDTRLTVDSGGARLAGTLKGKAVDHLCGQLRLVRPAPATAAVDPAQAELFRDPDWAERAAGEGSGAYGGRAP